MKKIICCLLGIFILLTSDYYSPAAFASEISINGPETVVKPADADAEIYSSVKYTLVTDTSDAVSAYWHSDDFSMTDSGDLILEASTEAKSGIIYAEYGGETYAKYITVINGSVNTFEQSKPGAVYGSSYKYAKALQASGNGNESVYYECGIDPSGFYYLKPATDVTSADYVTVSLDTFLTGDKKANHVPGLTACNTGWSGAVSLAIENGLYKFTAENYIADGNLLETYDYVTDIPAGKWVSVQMVVNIKDSSYDYYVDNTKIFENLHIKPMGFTDKNGTVNEVALRNIYIGGNVVLPGTIKTERWVKMGDSRIVDGTLTPIGDISDFEDIANAAWYLGSDESKNVTGTEITVDGGMSCQLYPQILNELKEKHN